MFFMSKLTVLSTIEMKMEPIRITVQSCGILLTEYNHHALEASSATDSGSLNRLLYVDTRRLHVVHCSSALQTLVLLRDLPSDKLFSRRVLASVQKQVPRRTAPYVPLLILLFTCDVGGSDG